MKATTQHLKLMIVDNHAETREMVRELVGEFAGEVRECANGQEAASEYAEFRPDLVTMDLNMPLTDGLEAKRQVLAEHPAARIIVITDFDNAGLRNPSGHSGACQFFAKDNLPALLQHLERQHKY